ARGQARRGRRLDDARLGRGRRHGRGEGRAGRLRKADMPHHPLVEKGGPAPERLVDELVDQHQVARRHAFPQRADRRDRQHARRAGRLERADIGAVVDLRRREPVPRPMARQEDDARLPQPPADQRSRGGAERRRHDLAPAVGETVDVVEPAAAENPEDHRCLTEVDASNTRPPAVGASADGMADGDFIDYLVAHGAYAEAAREAAERGELRRAIGLYERVWRFADAWPLALELGDRPLAVRLALDANLPAQAAEIAAAAPPEALLGVAEAFAARGRTFEAAQAAERAGAWARAAGWYRRAGAPLDEARAETQAGALREAGLIYERLVAQGSGEEALAARLALGKLLARLGRAEEAVRHLQIVARAPALRVSAWRALCGPLLALGFPGAAAELAARLHQADPSLPRLPEEVALLEEAVAETGREATASPDVGRRYHLRRLLGAGAIGRVYEAFDSLLGAPVALKLLAVGGGGGGEPERQAYLRFAREAEAAGRLRHPNIVGLADAQPGSGLFVFELMSGGTLADRLATSGPLPLAAARRVGLDLLAALGAAHERGIVHRDVKPANVFFDAAGNTKLGDFGSAHLADFGQTQTGGFFGTVAYMSPEQITGAPIGQAADLYALGATLLEALTGAPPFLGPDLVAQHLGEPPPPPSSRRPGLSAIHDDVLTRALAKAPGDRFASALEMAEAV